MAKAGFIFLFYLAINMAAGITTNMFVDNNGNLLFNGFTVISPDAQTDVNSTVTIFASSVQPSNTVENKGNLFYRVFDMLNLGFISNLMQMVKGAITGIPDMVRVAFGTYWCDGPTIYCEQSNNIWWAIWSASMIIYGISGLIWWSGRNISE